MIVNKHGMTIDVATDATLRKIEKERKAGVGMYNPPKKTKKSADAKPKTRRCAICCVERQEPMLGIKSDHLRTICVRDRRPLVLERGYFMPRLQESEEYLLQHGEQMICSNRKACRQRQAAHV